ncbi:MAG: TonB-dependent receptor [Bacteroidota bacterium]
MKRSLLLFWLISLACTLAAEAQSIRIDVTDAPLVAVLESLRTSSGVDVVFASSLADGVRSTCFYEGDDAGAALGCVLHSTGLAAERVRRRQFVLVRAPEQSEDAEESVEAAPRYSLIGIVRDAATGEILPGAHVVIEDLRTGTSTNDAGYFALPGLPEGRYDVRISFLGYETEELSVESGAPMQTFRLRPLTFDAGNVLVESDRAAPAGFPPPSGVVSVPVRDLERLPTFPGEQDLLHALQWFPGVQKAGEVNGGLVIRGGSPDQNLYLLDGAPVYHPWHAFSLVSTFQTETFSDVKLYRGSFPAEHGGRLASVLDAQLKDGNRDGPRAVAALGALSGRFMIESPLTRSTSFMVSGRRSYIDKIIGNVHAVEDASGTRDTLRTGYFFHDLAMKASAWSGTRHRVSLSYYRGGDQLDLRLPFDLSLDFSSWLRPVDLFFEIDQQWTNDVTSLRYQYLLGTRFFTTFTAYRSSYRAHEGTFVLPSAHTHLISNYDVALTDVGLRWDAEWYFALDNELRTGIHLVNHDFRSGLDSRVFRSTSSVDTLDQYSRQNAVETALYVQHTWRPSSRLNVQPGVRAAHFSGGAYWDVSPRVGMQFAAIPDELMFRFAAGRYVQYMHRLRDRYSFLYDLVSSRWIATNSDVQPATSNQVTAGVEVRPLENLTVSSDVYWHEGSGVLLPEDDYQTKDGLDGPGIDVGAVLGQFVPGDSRAYGLELNSRFEPGRWEFWVSYTGSRSLNRTVDDNIFRPGRFDVPRRFRALLGHRWRRLRASASFDARSGYAHTVPVARYVLDDPLGEPNAYLHRPDINNGRLPPYYHIDLAISYNFDWAGARWNASLQVFNVTNRRNVIARQYLPADGGIKTTDRRGMPILPLFEFEMRL